MYKEQNKQKLSILDGGAAFFLMIVCYVFLSFFGQAVCAAIFDRDSVYYTAIRSTFSSISILGIITCFKVKSKLSFSDLLGIKRFNPIYILFALMLSVGMFLGVGFVNIFCVNLLEKLGAKIPTPDFPLDNLASLLIFSVVLALLPAILEETFFRGLLLNSFNGVKTIFVLLIVNLCFAFYHCSLAQFVYQFIYGVGLTLLAIKSKSVFPSIIAHFINNFCVIIFEYFKVKIDLFNPFIIAVGLAVLALFFFWIYLFNGKESQKDMQSKQKSLQVAREFFIPFGASAVLICLTILIGSLLLGA